MIVENSLAKQYGLEFLGGSFLMKGALQLACKEQHLKQITLLKQQLAICWQIKAKPMGMPMGQNIFTQTL